MEGEDITILWDMAPSNGAPVTYTVTVHQNGQEVHTDTTDSSTLTVTREELQEQDDALTESSFEVTVSATNVVGDGGEATATITIPSGIYTSNDRGCIILILPLPVYSSARTCDKCKSYI